ncbi:MAG: LysR family transcriptional regulator [Myxococcota bacterium]
MRPDFNLLVALEALLAERSVAGAARRLGLSTSATSRTLARLRASTGDPLLVKAGRGMVLSPRALALREEVAELVRDARTVLEPVHTEVASIKASLVLCTGQGFVENFGPAILQRLRAEAPGIRLRFVHKRSRESGFLRSGEVDLETGVINAKTGPEVRTQLLFRDRFVGVVRSGHMLARKRVTLRRFCSASHAEVLQHAPGPVDRALAKKRAERDIQVVVEGFATLLSLTRAADFVACVPERYTGVLRRGMHSFELPCPPPEIRVSLLWHPRSEASPAHRWLRQCVHEVCKQTGTLKQGR